MLGLLKFVLERVDVLQLAKYFRDKRNRKASAQLFLILATTYDIIELYRTILDELHAALRSQTEGANSHKFNLNHWRMRSLLSAQWSNLERLETMLSAMREEVGILESDFAQSLDELFPGKFGILFEAQQLLHDGRLALGEADIKSLPKGRDGKYRTLWFTDEPPTEDRAELAKYLHGWDGTEKDVIDVNFHDGKPFFDMLDWYFRTEQPEERLAKLKVLADRYKQALIDQLTLEDVLAEIGNLKRYENWAENL